MTDPFQGVTTMPVDPPNAIYPAPMGVSYVVKPMADWKYELLDKVTTLSEASSGSILTKAFIALI